MTTKYKEPVGGFSHVKKENERINKERAKEEREREKQRRSWPRLELPSDNGEMIYVHRKIYEGITKKVNVISSRVIGGAGGKLVIEYEGRIRTGKRFSSCSRGILELCDIGPGGQ